MLFFGLQEPKAPVHGSLGFARWGGCNLTDDQAFTSADLATMMSLLVPSGIMLAAAVVLGHGLGNDTLQATIVGRLVLTDLVLLVWLFRRLGQRQSRGRWPSDTIAALTAFLCWSLLATFIDGTSITPLLRLSVYGAIFVGLGIYGVNRRQIYVTVVLYSVLNIVAGVVLGQDRLIGFDVGDPAQMGGLILAALCPIISGELKFRGRWLVVGVLLSGIIFTQTRSVWFATIVVLVVWLQRKLSPGRIITLIVIFGAMGLEVVGPLTRALGLNESSADLRVQSISDGIHSGLATPLFGSGWARVSALDGFGGSHLATDQYILPYNLFVNIFTSVGIPGLLFFLVFLAVLLRRLVPKREAPLLFTVAVLAMSLTEMTIYAGSTLTILFFIYAGMGLSDRLPVRALVTADVGPSSHFSPGTGQRSQTNRGSRCTRP